MQDLHASPDPAHIRQLKKEQTKVGEARRGGAIRKIYGPVRVIQEKSAASGLYF